MISSLNLLVALLAALRLDNPREVEESMPPETSLVCSGSDSFCTVDFDFDLFFTGVEVEGLDSEGRPRLDLLVDASAADTRIEFVLVSSDFPFPLAGVSFPELGET
jgi:hypothetical protein